MTLRIQQWPRPWAPYFGGRVEAVGGIMSEAADTQYLTPEERAFLDANAGPDATPEQQDAILSQAGTLGFVKTSRPVGEWCMRPARRSRREPTGRTP
jgi:hypothetical protein